MANKYCNLVGTNKIKDEYSKINAGFDGVETDINAVDSRVDNIVNNPDPNKDLELVDARQSTVKSKTFTTLDARLEEAEQDTAAHKSENVTQASGVHGLKIEEGTFTPLLQLEGVANNNTYFYQEGKYYKVGKLVYIKLRIKINIWDTGITGTYMQIRGLPFATTGTSPATIGRVIDITFDKGVLARVEGNYIALFNITTNNTGALVSSSFKNGSEIDVSAVYNIA
jgi:hypothetical protein